MAKFANMALCTQEGARAEPDVSDAGRSSTCPAGFDLDVSGRCSGGDGGCCDLRRLGAITGLPAKA